ncbi:uncharacterized protein LOC131947423 [Physella acuta]|uniref:uncharacterized protein LOC131947423 n=1 Tax=Physella acuta TaxID=109671 RepID=UPI0027DD1822|nr:uncharacterized protein LOC131947423 [Physella acuta]
MAPTHFSRMINMLAIVCLGLISKVEAQGSQMGVEFLVQFPYMPEGQPITMMNKFNVYVTDPMWRNPVFERVALDRLQVTTYVVQRKYLTSISGPITSIVAKGKFNFGMTVFMPVSFHSTASFLAIPTSGWGAEYYVLVPKLKWKRDVINNWQTSFSRLETGTHYISSANRKLMSGSCKTVITRAPKGAYMFELETNQISSLQTNQIRSLGTNQISSLQTNQISSLQTNQISSLQTNQIRSLGTNQISSLQTNQIRSLGTNQISSLQTNQISSLQTNQISSLQTNQISSLQTNQIRSLGTNQIRSLEYEIRPLIEEDFTWKDTLTECTHQNAPLAFSFNRRLCEATLVNAGDGPDVKEEIANGQLYRQEDAPTLSWSYGILFVLFRQNRLVQIVILLHATVSNAVAQEKSFDSALSLAESTVCVNTLTVLYAVTIVTLLIFLLVIISLHFYNKAKLMEIQKKHFEEKNKEQAIEIAANKILFYLEWKKSLVPAPNG